MRPAMRSAAPGRLRMQRHALCWLLPSATRKRAPRSGLAAPFRIAGLARAQRLPKLRRQSAVPCLGAAQPCGARWAIRGEGARTVVRSGVMPKCACAQPLAMRKPVMTSSKHSSAPSSVHMSRRPCARRPRLGGALGARARLAPGAARCGSRGGGSVPTCMGDALGGSRCDPMVRAHERAHAASTRASRARDTTQGARAPEHALARARRARAPAGTPAWAR